MQILKAGKNQNKYTVALEGGEVVKLRAVPYLKPSCGPCHLRSEDCQYLCDAATRKGGPNVIFVKREEKFK